MSKSPDLLQALLDRRKAEKAQAEAAQAGASTPASPPAAAAPTVKSVPESAASPEPSARLPIVEIKARSAANVSPASSNGITLTFPMFVTALILVGTALVGAFLLGRWSLGSDGGATTSAGSNSNASTPAKVNIPSPPTAAPFEWAKKFTVEATSSGSSKAELDRLVDLSKYLGKLGVAASPFEVKESGKSVGAIFLGGADSGNDKSLVKLRDWLREIPGPDGAGRPFQSARIRETPKQDKR